jgi:large subunit ribosomal protein L14
MVQLRTVLTPADNTGAKKMRLIHVHGGSSRRFGYLGDIVTASVIAVDPQGQFKKGEVVKAVIVRTKKETKRADGSYVRFDDNAAVIIDNLKNKNPRGTRIFGPIAREVKEKGFNKIASLAPEVL